MLDQIYKVVDTMQRNYQISRHDAIEIVNQIMIICTTDNSIDEFSPRAQPRNQLRK